MRLAIIIGHTEKNQGALSPSLRKQEYAYWNAFAIDLWRELRSNNIDAQVFKRDAISIAEVANRATKFIDEEGAAIELHFNAHEDTTVSGIETLCVGRGVDFASIVHKNLILALTEKNPNYIEFHKDKPEYLKPKDRGVKVLTESDRGYTSLSRVLAPACLIEPFFGTNRMDSDRFDRNKSRCVTALVDSVLAYDKIISP